jgi:hypothetical protein
MADHLGFQGQRLKGDQCRLLIPNQALAQRGLASASAGIKKGNTILGFLVLCLAVNHDDLHFSDRDPAVTTNFSVTL